MGQRSRAAARSLQSNTYRFFVEPAALQGPRVQLDDPELAHQIGRVLRLGPGDRVLLLDGLGQQYEVQITAIDRRGITGAVERSGPADAAEPAVALTVALPLIRAERFEWALQKLVELGVAELLPTVCARSLEAWPDAKRMARWRRIIREAAEQSRRGRLPQLHEPLRFADACARAAAGPALLLWEGVGAGRLRDALAASRGAAQLTLLSGPEGSLTPEEQTTAIGHGIMPVSLGPRTLRAETAPLAAVSAALYELGEWDGEQPPG